MLLPRTAVETLIHKHGYNYFEIYKNHAVWINEKDMIIELPNERNIPQDIVFATAKENKFPYPLLKVIDLDRLHSLGSGRKVK